MSRLHFATVVNMSLNLDFDLFELLNSLVQVVGYPVLSMQSECCGCVCRRNISLSEGIMGKGKMFVRSCPQSRTVNIRITESVLEELKRRSQEEGVPYQTLISSILHKYVTNRLVEEGAIRKSLQMLQQ